MPRSLMTVLMLVGLTLGFSVTPAFAAPPACGDSLVITGIRMLDNHPVLPFAPYGEFKVVLVDINRFLRGSSGVFTVKVTGSAPGEWDYGPYNASSRGANATIEVLNAEPVMTAEVKLLNSNETAVLCADSRQVVFDRSATA